VRQKIEGGWQVASDIGRWTKRARIAVNEALGIVVPWRDNDQYIVDDLKIATFS
jgi:hypothetical protein